MWYNQLKTAVLLAVMSGLLMITGALMGGMKGLTSFIFLSLVMNGLAYFFSDKLVLNMYRAQPLDPNRYPQVFSIVQELAHADGMPMPTLWYIPLKLPNAFATGRGPGNASVGVTDGILNLLDDNELRGVLAHELSHVKNRDILINSVAAVFATAIGFVSNFMQQMTIYGRDRNEDQQPNQRTNPIAALLMIVFMPLAATLLRFSISRTRELMADESGAWLSRDPLALASALSKLQEKSKELRGAFDPRLVGTAHMLIVSPFAAAEGESLFKVLGRLFASHPPIEERVEKLKKIYQKMIGR